MLVPLAVIGTVVVAAAEGSRCPGGPPETGYSSFGLPDLMVSADGSPVRTARQWEGRRTEIKELLMTHIFGSPPPAHLTPVPSSAVLVANYSDVARGFRDEVQGLRHHFGSNHREVNCNWAGSETEPETGGG